MVIDARGAGLSDGLVDRRWFRRVVVVLFSALVCAFAFSVPYLPTGDGPNHTLGAVVAARDAALGAASPHAAAWTVNEPWSARGYLELMRAFQVALPWRAAHNASLAVILLVFATGVLALCQLRSRQRFVVGVLGFGLVVQWSAFIGLYPYLLAVGLGLWTLAVDWGGDKPRRGVLRVVVTLLLLTATALCHSFTAALAGALLGAAGVVTVVGELPSRRLGRVVPALLLELVRLAFIGAPALFIAEKTSEARTAIFDAPPQWLPPLQRAEAFVDYVAVGPAWRGVALVVVAVLGLLLVLLQKRDARAAAIAVASLAAAALAWGLPWHWGWQFMATRALPFALVLPLALWPVEKLSAGVRLGVFVACGAFSVASLLWGIGASRTIASSCVDALSGLEVALPPAGVRAQVGLKDCPGLETLKAQIPHLQPVNHLGQLYAIHQGGWMTGSLEDSASFNVLMSKDDPKIRSITDEHYDLIIATRGTVGPAVRAARVRALGNAFQHLDGLVVYAPAADREALVAMGYRADHQSGDLLIARFAGCRVDVELSGAAAGAETVEIGAWPLLDGVSVPLVDGRGRATGVPCGPGWLRHPKGCAGADASGRAPVVVTDGGTVACTLSAPPPASDAAPDANATGSDAPQDPPAP